MQRYQPLAAGSAPTRSGAGSRLDRHRLLVLREALTTYLMANHVDDAARRLIVLCADEALINAVAHAAGSPVGVFADLRDDHLTLEVSDGGPGFDPSQIDSDAEPDLMGEHGRGLFLIRKLMDDLEILSDEHGTTLHMETGRAGRPPLVSQALRRQRSGRRLPQLLDRSRPASIAESSPERPTTPPSRSLWTRSGT